MARVHLENCTVDLDTGEIRRADGSDRLTPQLTSLLAWLVAHPDRVASRDTLHREVWGFADGVVSRAADVAMRRLRVKVERDPSAPRHLLSLRGEGYRFVPLTPSPRPASTPLPDPFRTTSTLVGRAEASADLADALSRGGLVAISGPAGVGKTALLREVSADLECGSRRWVDLEDVTDADTLLARVAAALDVTGTDDDGAAVQRALAASGPLVLVLDGADAVLEFLEPWMSTWTAAAPELVLCVTARERPGLRRARHLPLGPLSRADARRLFASLGGRGDGTDTLLDQLDGLPLAVALAADRCALLSPTRLAERFAERFDVLVSRDRDTPARHRTLRAALDVSWNLLDDADRRVLVALACAADTVTLRRLEALLDDAGLPVLDVVHRLFDRSLVVRGDDGLGLLNTVRRYVREVARDDVAALAERHATLVLAEAEPFLEGRVCGPGDGLMRDVLPHVPDLQLVETRFAGTAIGTRATAALAPWRAATLDPDVHLEILDTAQASPGSTSTLTSIRAARAYLLAYHHRNAEADTVLAELLRSDTPAPWGLCGRLLAVVNGLWLGRTDEALAQLPALIDALDADERPRWALEARLVHARVLRNDGEIEAARLALHRLRTAAEDLGERNFQGRAWLEFARTSLWVSAHDRARGEVRRAIALLRVDPPSPYLLDALAYEGIVASRQGHEEEALVLYEEVVDRGRRTDQRRRTAFGLTGLAGVLHRLGRYDEILPVLEEAYALSTDLRLDSVLPACSLNLGIAHHHTRDAARARPRYEESIDRYTRMGMPFGAAMARAYLVIALADLGEGAAARQALAHAADEADAVDEAETRHLVDLASMRLDPPEDLPDRVARIRAADAGTAAMCDLVLRAVETRRNGATREGDTGPR